ncbi:alpha/beta fold hydrolase [Flavobacterium muglaense]|uniref:Alpha/beta hydrolase n=1 Tax=Flavobacterium muglaense TaxID=2764716 RepID=A0A923SGP2_9FLAO|nr:alpha/beta hydrolase [Flavobacterium muglaense]MBC5839273.1 alpha/beta hydrolase [Flavobacterium muglaense]MBC5845785.1 alpha/beta hydrolase [Flavobacterium muglaense]
MISYTIYENKNATQASDSLAGKQWVTFVHGAGGSSSIWFKQIRDFQKQYNVLLLDLRGHGNSKPTLKSAFKQKYTFSALANDILEVLDHLKIEKSHFIGISLGTILIRQLAEMYPNRVQTMILGGAILKMNFRSQVLMRLGNAFKYVMPYLVLYRFFAFVIMPRKNHKKSRLLFINEAKKMYQKEFIKWFKLTTEINPILKWFRQVELNIPTLYVMGEEDYMFLPSVKKVVENHYKSSRLVVIENCGHVVNVEKPIIFNTEVLAFMNALQ